MRGLYTRRDASNLPMLKQFIQNQAYCTKADLALVRLGILVERDRHGGDALMWAAGAGHLEICHWLTMPGIEGGAGLDPCAPRVAPRGWNGRTALHWASRNGQLKV